MVNCWEPQLLPWLELPLPEKGEPPEGSLGNCGLPCHLCYLLPWPECWEQAFLCLSAWLPISPFLASTLGASSSKPHIHPSMLYAVAGSWITFVVPQVCPGSLALFLFSTTVSAMAQWPSCMVFTVASTCTILLAQLTGPLKLNLTSLAFPKGASIWVIIIQRIRLPPLGQGSQFCNSFFETILEYVSNQWTTPCMGKWGLVTSLLSYHHSDMDGTAHLIFMCWVILLTLKW